MTRSELENLIVKYQTAYYDGNELVSDDVYDKLWDELQAKYPESSLLHKVGSDTIKGEKIKHWMVMGSQAKFNTEEGLREWIEKENITFPVLVQNKIDGNSLELQYRNGKLLTAVTRGDSEYGECADRAATGMPSVPKTIGYYEDVAIRGEVVMNKDVFREKYSNRFANPRNLTAGLIKNERFEHYEDLRFIAYDTNKEFKTENDKYAWLYNMGFTVVETLGIPNIDLLIKYRNSRNPRDREYAIDGLVLKQNVIDPNDAKEVRPNKQHAFKWSDIPQETILRSIEWSLTGASLTPVAIFDPVELEGTTVKRASLSNPSYIRDLGLKIGDRIEVTKHGQIIPHVDRVISHCGIDDIMFPEVCPVCGQPLTLRDNYKKLYCDNDNCKTHFAARLAKWLNVFDVKGFGKAMQQVAIDLGIDSIVKLYDPESEKKVTEVVGVNATKAFKDLREKTANVDMYKVIAGYNLANIGEELAKTITDADLDIHTVTVDDLIKLDGWSNLRANKLLTAFATVGAEIKELSKYINIVNKETEVEVAESSIKNLHICVTGKLLNYKRKDLEELLTQKGAILDSNVTAKTNILVTNDASTGSTKLQAAEKYGTKIINENELIEMIG